MINSWCTRVNGTVGLLLLRPPLVMIFNELLRWLGHTFQHYDVPLPRCLTLDLKRTQAESVKDFSLEPLNVLSRHHLVPSSPRRLCNSTKKIAPISVIARTRLQETKTSTTLSTTLEVSIPPSIIQLPKPTVLILQQHFILATLRTDTDLIPWQAYLFPPCKHGFANFTLNTTLSPQTHPY